MHDYTQQQQIENENKREKNIPYAHNPQMTFCVGLSKVVFGVHCQAFGVYCWSIIKV